MERLDREFKMLLLFVLKSNNKLLVLVWNYEQSHQIIKKKYEKFY